MLQCGFFRISKQSYPTENRVYLQSNRTRAHIFKLKAKNEIQNKLMKEREKKIITTDVNSKTRTTRAGVTHSPLHVFSVKSYPSCQCRSCSLDLETLPPMLLAGSLGQLSGRSSLNAYWGIPVRRAQVMTAVQPAAARKTWKTSVGRRRHGSEGETVTSLFDAQRRSSPHTGARGDTGWRVAPQRKKGGGRH